MSFSISKEFSFSASHQLLFLPEGHQCHRLHGHNYAVRIELSADDLDDNGFVLDYAELDFIKEYIDTKLDHRHLNKVLHGTLAARTTAESLCRHFAGMVADHLETTGNQNVTRIVAHVSETPKTWAKYETFYSPEGDPWLTMKKRSPVPMAGPG